MHSTPEYEKPKEGNKLVDFFLRDDVCSNRCLSSHHQTPNEQVRIMNTTTSFQLLSAMIYSFFLIFMLLLGKEHSLTSSFVIEPRIKNHILHPLPNRLPWLCSTRVYSQPDEDTIEETEDAATAVVDEEETAVLTNEDDSEKEQEEDAQKSESVDVATMRVKEIKNELEGLNVDFTDCFDKESLVIRLQDARSGTVQPKPTKAASSTTTQPEATTTKVDPPKTSPDASAATFDKEATLEELRGMKIRDLREELGRRQIPRAGLFEKEDLIQALLKGRELASQFSVTGFLQPGQVADLTGDQLQQELSQPASSPMLLDVYATWCGPCKMMAPELEKAASEFGTKVRVVKMDSDKHPQMASQLKVGGLPTLVLFQSNGQELDRVEGALMKDQLMGWVNSKL